MGTVKNTERRGRSGRAVAHARLGFVTKPAIRASCDVTASWLFVGLFAHLGQVASVKSGKSKLSDRKKRISGIRS